MRLIIALALLALPVFLFCGFTQPQDFELTQLTPAGYKTPSALSAVPSWEQRADGAVAVAEAEAAVESHPTGVLPRLAPAVVTTTPAEIAAANGKVRDVKVTPKLAAKSRAATKRTSYKNRRSPKRRQLMSRR